MSDFFKVTVDIKVNEDWTSLYGWLGHFDRTGMPAGVVMDQATNTLAVWRPGRRITALKGSEVDKIGGVLYIHVNDFGKLWRSAGGKMAMDPSKRRYKHAKS